MLDALIFRGLFAIGLCIAAWGAWHQFTGHYINEGRAEVQAKWDADKAARLKAFADMTTKWVVAAQDAEKAQETLADERHKAEVIAQQRAHSLPPAVAAIRIPAVAVSVPNDALGGSPPAGPSPKPQADTAPSPADSNVGLVIGWTTDTVIPLYNACLDEVKGWQAFYQSLRDRQGKQEKP
jgi:hypothetical protein